MRMLALVTAFLVGLIAPGLAQQAEIEAVVGVLEVSLAIGDGSAGVGGARQLVRAGEVEPPSLAGLGLGRPDRSARSSGLLPDALFHAINVFTIAVSGRC